MYRFRFNEDLLNELETQWRHINVRAVVIDTHTETHRETTTTMTTPQSAQKKVVGDALIKCITTVRALFRRDGSPRTLFALCLLVLSGGLTTVYYYGTVSSQRDEEEDTTSGKETTSKTTTLTTRAATPETAWETLANLALFCACVATIGILMGVRRARKMIFSQPHIEGQPATSRGGDGLNTSNNNNGQQKSWNGSQWVEPPVASVLTSPYRNASTTSSHGVAASARPPDANWAKAKGPNSVWSGDGDGTNGANGSSLDNNNNDDNIDFATGFGYSEGVTSETARERAYRETLWARREAEELEAEENEEDQRHHHEYFTKHDEYEDRRSSNNKQQKTSSSSSSSSKKEKESAAAKRERRWSKFDQRWESLDASSSTSRLPLTYNDIPWPPKMAKLLERKISERQDASDSTVLKKKVYRELIMRWHPDKFMQKYGKRVRAGGDEDRIKERVDAIAKSLSASMTSL